MTIEEDSIIVEIPTPEVETPDIDVTVESPDITVVVETPPVELDDTPPVEASSTVIDLTSVFERLSFLESRVTEHDDKFAVVPEVDETVELIEKAVDEIPVTAKRKFNDAFFGKRKK